MSCGTGGGCNGCSSSEKRGCGTSSVFNWLDGVDTSKSNKNKDLIEVQFKMNRKEYFHNSDNISVSEGDFVAVESNSGHDIGRITLIGEIVYYQLKRKKIDPEKTPLKKIYRLAKETDLEKYEKAIELENPTLKKAKLIIQNHKLEMKLVDVEFQGDKSKAIFYYTANKRVDFRELIKELSKTFGVRIEMRQIGVRQEAAMVGGIGSCGRELCCSTWMTDFPGVSTSSARYQQLSINPQKISGQCGRLKCCLNFELDGYTEALKEFPSSKTQLKTKRGTAKFVKLDVFKGLMYYFNPENTSSELLEIPIEGVRQIIEINKNGQTPQDFDEFTAFENIVEVSFKDAMGQDNINRFDKKKHKRKKKRHFDKKEGVKNKKFIKRKTKGAQKAKQKKDA